MRNIARMGAGVGGAALVAGLALACPRPAHAAGPAAPDDRLAAVDKGSATIDVSGYPKPHQESYNLFVQKCSKCHTLARAINSDYVLPDEWNRYVKRMMRKPGSGIAPKDGKRIYEFLVYDSQVRKAGLIRKKQAAGKR